MPETSDHEARSAQRGAYRFDWSQQRVDGAVIVRLAGELDTSASVELRRRLMDVVEPGGPALVLLDLSDLRFIDAHCVGLILSAWNAARSNGRRPEVDGLRGMPATVFDLLGLQPLLSPTMREGSGGRDSRGRQRRAPRGATQRRIAGGAHGAG